MSVPGGYRADVAAPTMLPFLVPAIDADGNDIGGIRLPEQAVPLATITGWQFRSERIGMPNLLLAMAGAFMPFPISAAERERLRDPRRAIAEAVHQPRRLLEEGRGLGTGLAHARYILPQDVRPIVQEAGQHWDALMQSGTSR